MRRYHVTTWCMVWHMGSAAIGIIRVSQVRGREGDSFASPEDQRARIEAECERQELHLIDVVEELDVKGATPLSKRDGLRSAIESVEAGQAEVIVVAYFDRLVRSMRIQEEILERVESAGGKVLAVDAGAISGKTSAQWLSSTLMGAVNEYHGKVLAERVRGAQAAAVARGVPPWSQNPPGYSRNAEGVYEPDENKPVAIKMFEMRAAGKSQNDCREHLLAHGIRRTLASVGKLLSSRIYLGELRFGDFHNPKAHKAIISPELFAAAQRAKAPRGRTAKSQLLLARLGVLRCGTCDSRLVAGTSNHKKTPCYRCKNPDCRKKVVVSANLVDPMVVDAVKRRLGDLEGRASAVSAAQAAVATRDAAQAKLDEAMRAFADLSDEPVAIETLAKLRAARDAAEEQVKQLGSTATSLTVTATADWDRLTLDERRGLIRATIASVTVSPGRGEDRIAIHLVGE
jgi:DNA invertase Pin-like site-specific DNA recombinase